MANNTTTAGNIQIKISADGSSVNATVDNVKNKFQELGTHGVSSMQAVSASIRLAEGGLTNSLRAAERFLASFESIRAIAQTAFPVVGFLAVGGILAEMVGKIDKVVEAFKKAQRANLDLAASYQGTLSSIRTEGESLNLKLAQLEQQLNKINGKPTNNLKIALYESRLEAEKLNASMTRTIADVQKLFEQKSLFSVEGIMSALSTSAGNGDIHDRVQQAQDSITINSAITDPVERMQSNLMVMSGLMKDLTAMQLSAQKAQDQRDSAMSQRGFGSAGFDRSGRPLYNSQPLPEDQTSRLSQLRLAIPSLSGEMNNMQLGLQVAKEQDAVGAAQDARSNDEPLKGYRAALSEAKAQLAALKSEASTTGTDDPLVKGLEQGAAKASMEIAKLNQALKEGNHAPLTTGQAFAFYQADADAGVQKALNESTVARTKELLDLTQRMNKELVEVDEKHRQTLATIQEEITASQKLADAATKGPAAEAQAKIELELSKIPDQDVRDAKRIELENAVAASVATTTRGIQQQTQAVEDQIASFGKGIEAARALQIARIQGSGKDSSEIAALLADQQAKYRLEDLQSGRGGGTFSEGVEQWAHEWEDSMQSAAAITRSTLGTAVNDLNDQMARLVTGQSTSFAKMFMSIGEQLAKTGLKQAEGIGLKVLLGDNASGNAKPDGTPGNPLHVIIAGSVVSDVFGNALPGAPAYSGAGGALAAVAAAASGGGGGSKGGFGGFASGGLVGSLLGMLNHGNVSGGAPDKVDYNLPVAWNGPELGGVAGDTSSDGSTARGVGGFIASIFGALLGGLGHHASGGYAGSSPIVVGEMGPEIFTPSSGGGSITPNNRLGGVTNIYQVDARGSTDSAATKQQVMRGLQLTHQSAVNQAMVASKEQQLRRPIGG